MPAISIDTFYDDIYSDLYGGSASVLYLTLEIAFNPPTEDPDWTDVSADLRSFSTDRGRSREFSSFDAGTMTVVLDNRERQYDPTYELSDYYPNVVPMRRIRLKAWWVDTSYDIFTGYIDAWPQSYVYPHEATVSLHCTDAFKVFAAQRIPSVWEQEVRPDEPVSWWPLSDRSPVGNGADVAGDYPVVYVGEPSNTSGLLTANSDGAVSLNGTTQYVAVERPLTKPFSIEFWMKANDDQPSVVPHLLGFDGSNNIYFELYDNGGTLRFLVANKQNTGTVSAVDSDVNAFDGQRHHIVIQYSSSSQKIYVDGIDASTASGIGPVYTHAFTSGLLHFGDMPGIASNVQFAGVMDEVLIYDYLLSGSRIAAHYEAGRAPWEGQTTGERIASVLDVAGWSEATDIDGGNSTLTSAELNSSVLSHIQEADETESGRLFISASGVPTFVERQAVITETAYNTSQATFGDAAGELKYSDIVPDSDDLIYNDVEIRSSVFPPQRAEDEDSQAAYLTRSVSRDSLADTPEQMRSAAHWWLGRYKDPHLRVRSIIVKPRRDPTNLFPVVLGLELGERITVKRRPQAIGDPISQECHLESISHSGDAKSQSWETTYSLSSAEVQTFWRLGESLLGSTTRLAS